MRIGLGLAALLTGTLTTHAYGSCPQPGQWWQGERATPHQALLAQAAQRQVVLLGEQHDAIDHHRWQLHTLAGLHALREDMVIGLEMLPRSAQPVLDHWVAGQLTETELLTQSEWEEAWGLMPNSIYRSSTLPGYSTFRWSHSIFHQNYASSSHKRVLKAYLPNSAMPFPHLCLPALRTKLG
ncbi:hypothetical protein HAALTHF_05730n [Vreelandella aquamarina]|nr:hypothetical protein HAALTHF_05730n [Halomonas axialensis]